MTDNRPKKLAGRVAVITGGLTGIGLACAKALFEHGAKVAIGARRGGDGALNQSVREQVGAGTLVASLDVCSTTSVSEFISRVENEHGSVDLLVNAAGISVHQTVCGHDDRDWNAVIDTNLNGPFRMIRACLPGMIARHFGRIVNIASTAARTATADHAAYCASKAGLLGLTRAVALEGAPHGVTCIAVSPTWVETEMLRDSAATMAQASGRTQRQEIAGLAQSNPQGRLVQPEEIGALVTFLCSDAAPGLTMEDIQVNAGAHW